MRCKRADINRRPKKILEINFLISEILGKRYWNENAVLRANLKSKKKVEAKDCKNIFFNSWKVNWNNWQVVSLGNE